MEHQGTLHPLHPLLPPLRPSPSRPGRHLSEWRCLYKRYATTRKVDLDCQLYHNLQVKCWNPNYQCIAYLPTLLPVSWIRHGQYVVRLPGEFYKVGPCKPVINELKKTLNMALLDEITVVATPKNGPINEELWLYITPKMCNCGYNLWEVELFHPIYIWATKKTSYIPLYCLFNRDPYNDFL